MSIYSAGSQISVARSWNALVENYFDPRTVKIGENVPYRDEDDETGSQAWDDARALLRDRDLELRDTGSGYVVAKYEW